MGAIPDTHPRAKSLQTRHALIEGVKRGIVADSGLIAHGRGEAFDYLLGERTHNFSIEAIKAAAATLYLAEHPIISVNGNTTILCPEEMVKFSNTYKIPLEINLFYRSQKRIEEITKVFKELGANFLLGTVAENQLELDGFDSYRRIVDKDGIHKADVVVVPLEDGDRTENLVRMGKKVITVDLNPISRTALAADITIVDNIQRVFPLLHQYYGEMNEEKARETVSKYDNIQVIKQSLKTMSTLWNDEMEKKIKEIESRRN